MEEWAALYRYIKDVEEEYMSTECEMDRTTINADVDKENTSESSVSC